MILDRFKLDGKKALVTGAGRGIGRGMAQALAEAGADVAIVDVLADNAEQTAAEIAQATGRHTIAINCDIADSKAVDAMVEKVVNEFGRLDIAVNNAGISIPIKGLLDVSLDEWKKQFDV
ncbi:MAG: SDR family NAD(P)-dependent oxidoreductase, partial [Victivallales bacterium]|nr:SDR family NAD(P)-dependent oxidoreductase [Victivallales bacterium]